MQTVLIAFFKTTIRYYLEIKKSMDLITIELTNIKTKKNIMNEEF